MDCVQHLTAACLWGNEVLPFPWSHCPFLPSALITGDHTAPSDKHLTFVFFFGPFSAFARMLTPWNERPLSVHCTAEAPGAQSRLIAGNQLNDWMHMIVITTIIFLKEMRMARNKRLLYYLFIPQIYNALRWRAYAMEVNGPDSDFGIHPFLRCVTCCYWK